MTSLARVALGVAVLSGAWAPVAPAQSVISAKSGLIHYVEGSVYLNDRLIEPKFGIYPELNENDRLRTEDGRAEVLLTPGVFLRIGEMSGVRMVTNRLADTRLELLSGEALLQIDELFEGNSIALTYQDFTIQFLRRGIYRLAAEPPELRVYSGQAAVEHNGETKVVKEGRSRALMDRLQAAKFDKKDVDDLYRWSRHRSEYIAMANVSAASTMRNSGMFWGTTGWYWNPYFGMFTFIPPGDVCYDPWGFAYWSPFTVYRYVSGWPGYFSVGGDSGSGSSHTTSGSGSGSGSKPGATPGAHHPPGRIGHPPAPRPPGGVPRGITLAAEAHRSVSSGGGGHSGGSVGGGGHAGYSGGSAHAGGSASASHGSSGGSSSGSSGASSGGGGHSSSGGSAGGSSGGGGGSHK